MSEREEANGEITELKKLMGEKKAKIEDVKKEEESAKKRTRTKKR